MLLMAATALPDACRPSASVADRPKDMRRGGRLPPELATQGVADLGAEPLGTPTARSDHARCRRWSDPTRRNDGARIHDAPSRPI